jgi:hypothetical protein
MIELLLAGSWVVGLRSRAIAMAAVLLLILLSGVYVIHLAVGVAPECECLGKLLAFERSEAVARYLLIRNLILVAMVVPFLLNGRIK